MAQDEYEDRGVARTTTRFAVKDESWPEAMPRFEEVVTEKRHLLDDFVEQKSRLDRQSYFAERFEQIRIPPLVDLSGVVSLARYQTGFRNQTDRGTCYAFATVAALEAAYKRDHGLELDLSEQYAFHLNKAGELHRMDLTAGWPYENNSSFWGFQGNSDLVGKLTRSMIPEEMDAPYLSGTAMDDLRRATPGAGELQGAATQEQLDAFEFAEGHIPLRSRHRARFGVASFAVLPGSPTPDQVEAVIAAGHEVVADVPGHCLLIVGFNRSRREYLVKNSWGENDFITLSYDDASWPVLGGHFVSAVVPPDAEPQKAAWWLGRWSMDHDGWRGELVVRRTTDYRSRPADPTRLGSYYRDGARHDVNGFVEDGGQTLHFWVAAGTERTQPGTLTGQEFVAHVFSFDPENAAGHTSSEGTPYGLRLGRGSLAGAPTQGYDAGAWVGRWAMNHDGWRGTLDLRSAAPLDATYTAEGGLPLAVSGSVDPDHPHLLRLSIAFAPDNVQPFELLGHTWERDVFAGTTTWGGRAFGVQGTRLPG